MGEKTISKEIKIDKIAEALPLNEWFTKAEFSAYTGINLKSCTVRLSRIVKKGMLAINNRGKKNFYMMTDDCMKKMMIQSKKNKSVRADCLSMGRGNGKAGSERFDKLLFSTKII